MANNNSGRLQVFPYSLKTVATADQGAIGFSGPGSSAMNMLGLEIINPTNLYSVEDIGFHLAFLHNATQPGRNITRIAVQDDVYSPTWYRYIDVNIAPVALLASISKDLASLRNPNGRNIVFVTFDGAISGTIKVIKIDMLYTVLGIR